MSYDIHITRKCHWSDPEGPEISLSEWLAAVAADPEMELDEGAKTRSDAGSRLQSERECGAIWTAYTDRERLGNDAWFVYSDGCVTVRRADAEIICKMWSIAQSLSAKVQGDDGEIYDSCARASRPDRSKKRWWKFW
jgi:hypothetical protein